MSDYIISCESTADLTRRHFDHINVNYVCFTFTLDGVTYKDDLGVSMAFDEFYKRVGSGADVSTSQINTETFVEYFDRFLKEGKDIIHLCLSSGITGVMNSALGAKEILAEKYPEKKIYIIDSFAASSGFGLLVDKAAELRDKGLSIDELKDWLIANRLKLQHWFFSSDLSHYIRGGRISKPAGAIGQFLSICPLMNVNVNGALKIRYKIRGKKNVINEIVEKMVENAEGGLDYAGKCYISESACMDDARSVADLIEEKFKKLDGKVEIYSIGTVIGAHTGPGTVALFYWGKERVEE